MKQYYVTTEGKSPDQWIKLGAETITNIDLIEIDETCIIWISSNTPNWIDTIKKAKERTSKIAVTTEKLENNEFKASLENGARAYCEEEIKIAEILNIINALDSNAIWVPNGLVNFLLRIFSSQQNYDSNDSKGFVNLSPRESQVLEKILDGNSNKEISEKLLITTRTVKAHVMSVLHKYNAKDRIDLILKIGIVNKQQGIKK